ncbi:hypothetical protein AMECASPLE_011199, partial [Ameca splendens]
MKERRSSCGRDSVTFHQFVQDGGLWRMMRLHLVSFLSQRNWSQFFTQCLVKNCTASVPTAGTQHLGHRSRAGHASSSDGCSVGGQIPSPWA